MRHYISSMFLLTLCDTSLFNYFRLATVSFSTANTTISTRSTPAPTFPPNTETTRAYIYRRTAFDLLPFWSGESLRLRAHHDHMNHSSVEHPSHEMTFNQGHARRKIGRDGSAEKGGTSKGSTVGPPGDVAVDVTTDNNDGRRRKNLKLNGYTLKEDMIRLMSKVDANVTISTVGTTIEQHDIVLCQITRKLVKYFRALEGEDKYVVEEPQKKIILIVHGLIPMGFRKVPCLYQSDTFLRLVNMYVDHLDKFDIFLVPMGNPDGITDETLLIWNKNKSPQTSCPGVLVDRNFDVGWNKSEGLNSCSQDYPGPRPFSEAESRAIADLIHHYNPKIVAYIHVHAGAYEPNVFKGDAVLYPKGFINQPDDDKYGDMASEIEDAMRLAGFKVYGVTMTSLYNWYGQAPGTSVDYATTVYGIPYGMEFVMQPYSNDERIEEDSEEISDTVLNNVWKNVIDVVFNNIYKTTADNKDDSKK